MADDEQLVPSWADITGQLSAMNTRWQTELCAGLDREKNLKERVVELEEKNSQLVEVMRLEVTEKNSLKAANDDLLAVKDHIEAANKVLIAEKDSLEASNKELRRTLRTTESEQIMLKESLADAETARSGLDAELAGSVKQKLALEAQLARLWNEARTVKEKLREKQLEMERVIKHFNELLVKLKALREGPLTGVNKKVQVQLIDPKNEDLDSCSQRKGEAEVVEDPLDSQDTPLVNTNEKDTAVKPTKVTTAAVVMKSKGSPKKRPRRLVASGSGKRIKMSSAGLDISCEVVEARLPEGQK